MASAHSARATNRRFSRSCSKIRSALAKTSTSGTDIGTNACSLITSEIEILKEAAEPIS